MATWSFCGRHAGPDKPPTPVFINLDNVLTVERQGDLTTVLMVGGEKEGLHRHNAGNAYRRCPSCGSCVEFALTPSPSAMRTLASSTCHLSLPGLMGRVLICCFNHCTAVRSRAQPSSSMGSMHSSVSFFTLLTARLTA